MIEKRYVLKKSIRKTINRLMLMIIILLIGMIAVKTNPDLKSKFKDIIYNTNIDFIKNQKIYDKYFGNILTKNNSNNTAMVASEKLNYKKEEKYKDGVKLIVEDNYSVPILESGVVTYIKDNIIVVEQVDGIQAYYSNISNTNLKVYDYVEKGNILGEVKENSLYLKFKKNGKYLDYKKYI